MYKVNVQGCEIKSQEFSHVIGLQQIPKIRVASCWSFEENAKEVVWNKLLYWAKRNNIPLKEVNFFGFPNPIHPIQQSVYGYEAWIVLPDNVSIMDEESIQFKTIPETMYAVTKDRYDMTEDIHQNLEKWVILQNFDFGYSVCLEEYAFTTYRYKKEEYISYYMPVFQQPTKDNGTIIEIEPMVVAAKKCAGEKGNISRAVDWYVSEWTHTHWQEENYNDYRIFVTSIDQQQELLIKYPDMCRCIEEDMTERIIGGKYLSFTMSALMLKRNIPKYYKKLIYNGYTYDSDRFFIEEHYKHCGDYSKMMMGRIYFPIKTR